MAESYIHAEDLLWRRTFDGAVMLVPGRREFLHLSSTAFAVWECFGAVASPEEATAGLSNAYESDGAAVAADVAATVEDLVARGALVRVR